MVRPVRKASSRRQDQPIGQPVDELSAGQQLRRRIGADKLQADEGRYGSGAPMKEKLAKGGRSLSPDSNSPAYVPGVAMVRQLVHVLDPFRDALQPVHGSL